MLARSFFVEALILYELWVVATGGVLLQEAANLCVKRCRLLIDGFIKRLRKFLRDGSAHSASSRKAALNFFAGALSHRTYAVGSCCDSWIISSITPTPSSGILGWITSLQLSFGTSAVANMMCPKGVYCSATSRTIILAGSDRSRQGRLLCPVSSGASLHPRQFLHSGVRLRGATPAPAYPLCSCAVHGSFPLHSVIAR